MCLELIRVSEPKAKKEHPCIWCGEAILQGEKHHREVGKFDGRIQDGRFHEECWTASRKFWDENDYTCEFTEREFRRGSTEPR